MSYSYKIPRPHRAVFENYMSSVAEQAFKEKQKMYIIEKPTYCVKTGGMLTWYKDHIYPKKGFLYPEALMAANSVKKITMGMVAAFSSKYIIPEAVMFALKPWSWKIKTLENFLFGWSMAGNWLMAPHYYKNRWNTECTRGVRQLIFLLLQGLGISEAVAKLTAKVFSRLIEADDQYRYRTQDLFSLTTQAKLMADPRGELKRIFEIFKVRDKQVSAKFGYFVTIMLFALYHPKVKAAFVRAVRLTDIKLLQMDELDGYQCLTRGGYDYFGQTIHERLNVYINLYNGRVPSFYEVSS